ncbi:MAG TPA: MATE family efflux transporter [Geobacterales bacterium]|nr:MATE family efflux transporter [Geobacterales bacterium]
MEERNSNGLLTAPVPLLLRRLAIPAGTGFLFVTLFNVADTFYAGFISTTALAALALTFPLFFLIVAVAGGISTGATALIGHALGRNDRPGGELLAMQSLSFALIHGLALSLSGYLLAPPLLSLLGAVGETQQLAILYIRIIFLGSPLLVMNHACNAILNAQGDTAGFRNFIVMGALANMILDPWFMYGGIGMPPLGLAGIALATVSVHFAGIFFLLRRAMKTGLVRFAALRMAWPRPRIFGRLFAQAFPSSLNMLTVALGVFVITWFVGRFGAAAVAAYGIASRIEQLILMPVMGLNVATLAVVAQNSGAGMVQRVRQTIVTALRYGITLTSIGALAALFFASHLVGIFSADPEVIVVGQGYLRIASFVFVAYVILYINVFAWQGLKRPLLAVWLGLYRQILAPVPVFYLFAIVFNQGVVGVWWGILAVTWSAALMALIITHRILASISSDMTAGNSRKD